MNINVVVLAGNLTRDPELKVTQSGQPVANIGLAVNRKWKSKDGEAREETLFITVVAWGKTAELCAEHLRKGASVAVEGRLQSRSWETDGQKRSTIEVVADRVHFGRKGEEAGQ